MEDKTILNIPILEEIHGWGFNFKSVLDSIKDFKGDKIHLPINSFGGDVMEGFSIYNLLRGHQSHVSINIVTYAMSMGTVIALAGDEVTMSDKGWFMIHNPFTLAGGEAENLRHTADVLDKMTNDIAAVYVAKTGLSKARILQMMKEETWLSAKEALELGFVDRLTEGAKIEASFNVQDLSKFKNIPKDLQNFSNGASLGNMLEAWINIKMNEEDMSRSEVLEGMAEAADISVGTVRQILNGSINCPPVNRLEGFAEYFGKDVEELIVAGINDSCEYTLPGEEVEEQETAKNGFSKLYDTMKKLIQALNAKLGLSIDVESTEEAAIEAINSNDSFAKMQSQLITQAKAELDTSYKAELEALKTNLGTLQNSLDTMWTTVDNYGEAPGAKIEAPISKGDDPIGNKGDTKNAYDSEDAEWNIFADQILGRS